MKNLLNLSDLSREECLKIINSAIDRKINKKQSTEQYESTEENLVQDLKKSLEDTINETKYILDDLKQTVEKTIKDQTISD